MFLAARLLQGVGILPSAVYDLESFFWTLLFTLLHHNSSTQGERDKVIWKRLVSTGGTQDYDTDGSVKIALLRELRRMSVNEKYSGSVLLPYKDLIKGLADPLYQYIERGDDDGFKTYGEMEEVSAINNYITVFEKFVNKLEG